MAGWVRPARMAASWSKRGRLAPLAPGQDLDARRSRPSPDRGHGRPCPCRQRRLRPRAQTGRRRRCQSHRVTSAGKTVMALRCTRGAAPDASPAVAQIVKARGCAPRTGRRRRTSPPPSSGSLASEGPANPSSSDAAPATGRGTAAALRRTGCRSRSPRAPGSSRSSFVSGRSARWSPRKRDLALDAGGVDAGQHAGRHPALARPSQEPSFLPHSRGQPQRARRSCT